MNDTLRSQRPAPPVLLGLTMWLTWGVRPGPDETGPLPRISVVSYERLMGLGSRLEVNRELTPGGAHQLVRFNVYNAGEQSVALCAVALKSLSGETLVCALIPSLEVRAGARQPLMTEVTAGPVAESVDILVEDVVGRRFWVAARLLPES